MKTFLALAALAFLTFPLHAEVRGAVRAGVFTGTGNDAVGTIEMDVRSGRWAFAPAFDLIRGGHGLYAIHVNARHLIDTRRGVFWVGAGPTFVRSNAPSSETTWNVDAGLEWRTTSAWKPFVAARYYSFRLPAFRESLEGSGAVISIGIARRFR